MSRELQLNRPIGLPCSRMLLTLQMCQIIFLQIHCVAFWYVLADTCIAKFCRGDEPDTSPPSSPPPRAPRPAQIRGIAARLAAVSESSSSSEDLSEEEDSPLSTPRLSQPSTSSQLSPRSPDHSPSAQTDVPDGTSVASSPGEAGSSRLSSPLGASLLAPAMLGEALSPAKGSRLSPVGGQGGEEFGAASSLEPAGFQELQPGISALGSPLRPLPEEASLAAGQLRLLAYAAATAAASLDLIGAQGAATSGAGSSPAASHRGLPPGFSAPGLPASPARPPAARESSPGNDPDIVFGEDCRQGAPTRLSLGSPCRETPPVSPAGARIAPGLLSEACESTQISGGGVHLPVSTSPGGAGQSLEGRRGPTQGSPPGVSPRLGGVAQAEAVGSGAVLAAPLVPAAPAADLGSLGGSFGGGHSHGGGFEALPLSSPSPSSRSAASSPEVCETYIL